MIGLFQNIIHQMLKLIDFNVLIDVKSSLDTPMKNKEEAHENIIEMEKK